MNEEETLKEYFKNSPQNIQNFLVSDTFKNLVDKVGIEFDLRPSKVIDLKNEIIFALVGLEGRGDFLQNLNQNLDLPKELTGKIATYIDQNIFKQFKTELDQFEQLHKEAEETATEESVPINLPVQGEGEEIPTFSEVENVMSKSQYQMSKMETEKTISKPNEIPVIKVQSKPQYQHPQSTPTVQGLSQSDITQNRPKPKPYVPPTRDFSYRDEKIGGVNIQKEETVEIEENINREDLLNDIENPTKTESSGGIPSRPSYKGGDPYREPIE